jgi:chaperonin cofactor prefoldin
MKFKIALAASLVISLLAGLNRVAAQETPSLESRIAALEKQLRDIETQLVKLDFIATQVGKLSGKPAPQLATAAKKSAVADGTDTASDALVATEPSLPGDDLDEAATEDATEEDLLALFDAPDQKDEPQADQPASSTAPPVAEDNLQPAHSVEQRVTSIEQVATNIQSRLQLLDDIAEALDALGQKTGIGDSVRTAAKPAGPATELSDDDTTAPRRSTVVVNNWTGVVHWITVNGARVRVDPGRNRIPADYGALTTRVGDQEMQWDLTNWRKVGGEYELVLDLKP